MWGDETETRAEEKSKAGQLAVDPVRRRRLLDQCAQFYRCFSMAQSTAQLEWTHYQVLCPVADAARRKTLMARAPRGRAIPMGAEEMTDWTP